jgi:hypothetical protein
MQTALDYLLEKLLADANRVLEVEAKTTELRTGPDGDLAGSDHNESGSPEKAVERELTSHEEQARTQPESHGQENGGPSNVSRD